jgi:hypothetical protein
LKRKEYTQKIQLEQTIKINDELNHKEIRASYQLLPEKVLVDSQGVKYAEAIFADIPTCRR